MDILGAHIRNHVQQLCHRQQIIDHEIVLILGNGDSFVLVLSLGKGKCALSGHMVEMLLCVQIVHDTGDELHRGISPLFNLGSDMEVRPVMLFQLFLLADEIDQLDGHTHQAKEAVHALHNLAEGHLDGSVTEHLGELFHDALVILVDVVVLIHIQNPPCDQAISSGLVVMMR